MCDVVCKAFKYSGGKVTLPCNFINNHISETMLPRQGKRNCKKFLMFRSTQQQTERNKKRTVYAVRRHDGSLCTQKQPVTVT